ncbi:hypothetical protein MMC30_004154 [Trapelia coarctata]|nr:hypothetical protein [Trapelia coarctata]
MSVTLSVEDLADSCSMSLSTSKGEAGIALKEEPIFTDDVPPSATRYIGPNDDFELLLVKVKKEDTLASMDKPQALCLTVQFAPNSFLKVYEDDLPDAPSSTTPEYSDIKIDVFLNGQLVESTFVPAHAREGANASQLVQRFGGCRINLGIERPWILVPAGQNSDGSKRPKRAMQGGVGKRWNDIAETLKASAEMLPNRRTGEPSLLAEYLTAISAMAMPSNMDKIQQDGEAGFGVVDVVLTHGRGQREDLRLDYIDEPAHLSLGVSSLPQNARSPTPDHIGLDAALSPFTTLSATPSIDLDVDRTPATFPAPPPAGPPPVRQHKQYRPMALTPMQATMPPSSLPPKLYYLSQLNGSALYNQYLDKKYQHKLTYLRKKAAERAAAMWAPGPVPEDNQMDSVVTFAPGVYRPVKAERLGAFVESGIWFGARFIVG